MEKRESSIYRQLQNPWTPFFNGVTAFYEAINIEGSFVKFESRIWVAADDYMDGLIMEMNVHE
ncbi:MAG: hypothetical protein V1930_06600 [Pseudomonadota bacterium]